MLGNFTYCNPTKLYFGKDALDGLNAELPKYGKNVLLVYGGGSVKKNRIYDKVVSVLKANGKEVFEDAGVMPNPTADKLREGVARGLHPCGRRRFGLRLCKGGFGLGSLRRGPVGQVFRPL